MGAYGIPAATGFRQPLAIESHRKTGILSLLTSSMTKIETFATLCRNRSMTHDRFLQAWDDRRVFGRVYSRNATLNVSAKQEIRT